MKTPDVSKFLSETTVPAYFKSLSVLMLSQCHTINIERKSMNLLRMLVHFCRFEVHIVKCRCILGVNGFRFIELHVPAPYRYSK